MDVEAAVCLCAFLGGFFAKTSSSSVVSVSLELLVGLGRSIKVNASGSGRVIRVFLSRERKLHRESQQLRGLYLAALT